MYQPIQPTTTIPSVRNALNRSPWRRGFPLIPLVFTVACVALSPQARAVCQEGCGTSNDNTFLGDDALTSNPTGADNTAIGFDALFSNTRGFWNTAIGSDAPLAVLSLPVVLLKSALPPLAVLKSPGSGR